METANKIAVFDIDGTFFRWQLYHELIFAIKDAGLFSQTTAKSLEKALFDWKALKASWDDYEMQVVKVAENELTNINQQKLTEFAKTVIEKHGHRVYSYTLNLSKKLKNQGYFLLAISGSFQEIAEIFANKYGFDDCIGMVQKKDELGNFINGYERPIFGHKAEILQDYIQLNPQLTLNESYGVGDSGGDIDLLNLVSNPIAFNPTDSLLEAAKQNNWPIVIERKNIAYTLNKDNDYYKLVDYELY